MQSENINDQLPLIPTSLSLELQNSLKQQLEILSKRNFTYEDFPEIMQQIFSEDLVQLHLGVTGLRKMLGVEQGAPIQQVIDANLIPKLIEIIEKEVTPQLVLEAAWALANIAGGTTQQIQSIVDKGGIYLFVKLLSSPYMEIQEQAVWAIGNISGDCINYGDLILQAGGADQLIRILEQDNNLNTIKHSTWALSNLFRGRPNPDFRFAKNALPIFCKVIIAQTDVEILVDACWALSYITVLDNAGLQTVIDSGVIPTLIILLDHSTVSLVIPAIRILGNVLTGDETQVNYVFGQGYLKKVPLLLSHTKRQIIKEVCQTLSNIANIQVRQVLQNLPIIEKLFQIMTTEGEQLANSGIQFIVNATKHCNSNDIQYLVKNGLLKILNQWLNWDKNETLNLVLEAILMIMKKGIYQKDLQNQINFKLIQNLEKHTNSEVQMKSLEILELYYQLKEKQ